jgi:hypothetical protein
VLKVATVCSEVLDKSDLATAIVAPEELPLGVSRNGTQTALDEPELPDELPEELPPEELELLEVPPPELDELEELELLEDPPPELDEPEELDPDELEPPLEELPLEPDELEELELLLEELLLELEELDELLPEDDALWSSWQALRPVHASAIPITHNSGNHDVRFIQSLPSNRINI